MKSISSNLPKENMAKGRAWLPIATLVGLLLLDLILLFLPGIRLVPGMRVFYWQRYNTYLHQFQYVILILVPILALIGTVSMFRRSVGPWFIASLGTAIAISLFCLFVHYLGLFFSSSVTPVGTVFFRGNTYHLARYDESDSASEYFLGKCDRSGYQCVFQEIYNFFVTDPGAPQIAVNDDETLVLVKMGEDIVYTYDGQKGQCTDNMTSGWCIEPPP
jgi:hypothetical protein